VIILNSLEINIAIFICCVPALKTLYRRFTKKTGSYTLQQYNIPDSDKATKTKGSLDMVASQSDNTLNRQHGSIGDEGENWIGSPQELGQDVEKMGPTMKNKGLSSTSGTQPHLFRTRSTRNKFFFH
jgi:hypothetical protein